MAPAESITDLIALTGVDPEEMRKREERVLATQHGKEGYIPLIAAAPLTPEQEAGLPPQRNIEEQYASDEYTLTNGLRGAATMANCRSEMTPAIRANLGTGIGATCFGAVQTVFPDKMPWVTSHVPLADLDDFNPETTPLGEVAETALARSKYLAEQLAGSGITPYAFDTQSPFDLAHLVVGDDIFYKLYDEPERVHKLLDNTTRIIIRLTMEYKALTGEPLDGGRHMGFAMRGGVRVCEDTVTLLCEEHVNEFCVPYTRRVLAAFGGGWIHYCGHNEHLYHAVVEEMPECYAFNLGNPEMHDMEQVVADCLAQGKTYIGTISGGDEPKEDLFRRALSFTQGAGRGLILNANRLSKAETDLWRELQR